MNNQDNNQVENFRKRISLCVVEIGSIEKKSDNPFFKSKYVELADMLAIVVPILNKHNLTLLQPSSFENGKNVQRSIILDNLSSLHIESALTLPELTDPQKMVSATTYYRRATLQNLLSIRAVEDDDGNSLGSKPGKKSPNIKVTKTTNSEF